MRTGWMLVALLVTGVARGDTVTFKNGSKLEGIAAWRGETLEVRLPEGSLFFARERVTSIVPSLTPLAEYEQRLKTLGAKDAKGAFELGTYCEAHGMRVQAAKLYEKVLALAPDHEGAHQRLGHRKLGGHWMTPEEILTDLGLVQVKGEWMTPRAAQSYAELDERTRKLEARLASMEKGSDDLKRTLDQERRESDRVERSTDRRLRELESENQRLATQPPTTYYVGGFGYLSRRKTSSGPPPPSTNQYPADRDINSFSFGIPPVQKTILIP